MIECHKILLELQKIVMEVQKLSEIDWWYVLVIPSGIAIISAAFGAFFAIKLYKQKETVELLTRKERFDLELANELPQKIKETIMSLPALFEVAKNLTEFMGMHNGPISSLLFDSLKKEMIVNFYAKDPNKLNFIEKINHALSMENKYAERFSVHQGRYTSMKAAGNESATMDEAEYIKDALCLRLNYLIDVYVFLYIYSNNKHISKLKEFLPEDIVPKISEMRIYIDDRRGIKNG